MTRVAVYVPVNAWMGCCVPLAAGSGEAQRSTAGTAADPRGQDSAHMKGPQSVVRHPGPKVFSTP